MHQDQTLCPGPSADPRRDTAKRARAKEQVAPSAGDPLMMHAMVPTDGHLQISMTVDSILLQQSSTRPAATSWGSTIAVALAILLLQMSSNLLLVVALKCWHEQARRT